MPFVTLTYRTELLTLAPIEAYCVSLYSVIFVDKHGLYGA